MARTAKRNIAIKDEGVTLVPDVDSIDFAGLGVSLSAVNNDVTATINGSGSRTTALTDAASITLNIDTTDFGILSSLSQPTTFNNPTGTPLFDGQRVEVRITSASAQGLTWGTSFRGSTNVPLPSSTTGGGATDYIGFKWNSVSSKFDCAAVSSGF